MKQSSAGFVLVTAMIFLLVLTLVAVIAVKGSGLELRMSANNALHTEAFEAAEGPRTVIGRLIEVLGFNAETGWPVAIGGDTPDASFAFTIPARIEILVDAVKSPSKPLNWFIDLPESEFEYGTFTQRATYVIADVASGGARALAVRAEVDVKRVRTAPKTGCDLSSGGYDGVSARTCADYIFLITSRGVDQGSALDGTEQADYQTSSLYRYVPR